MELGLQLAENATHTARGEEVLHVVLAGGLQIDQHRRVVAEAVDRLERDRNAEPPGDRREVDDRVGRASDAEQHAQRVLDRVRSDDAVGRQSRVGQRHGRLAGRLGRA